MIAVITPSVISGTAPATGCRVANNTAEDTTLRADINVSYKAEAGLDLLVPAEMREVYTIRRNETRIDGLATYGHFRRFTVATTEKPKG